MCAWWRRTPSGACPDPHHDDRDGAERHTPRPPHRPGAGHTWESIDSARFADDDMGTPNHFPPPTPGHPARASAARATHATAPGGHGPAPQPRVCSLQYAAGALECVVLKPVKCATRAAPCCLPLSCDDAGCGAPVSAPPLRPGSQTTDQPARPHRSILGKCDWRSPGRCGRGPGAAAAGTQVQARGTAAAGGAFCPEGQDPQREERGAVVRVSSSSSSSTRGKGGTVRNPKRNELVLGSLWQYWAKCGKAWGGREQRPYGRRCPRTARAQGRASSAARSVCPSQPPSALAGRTRLQHQESAERRPLGLQTARPRAWPRSRPALAPAPLPLPLLGGRRADEAGRRQDKQHRARRTQGRGHRCPVRLWGRVGIETQDGGPDDISNPQTGRYQTCAC